MLAMAAMQELRLARDRELAVELARRSLESGQLHATAVSALHYSGFSLIAAGLLDEVIDGYDRAYDEAVRRGDATRLASVLTFRGRYLTMRGDINRALDDLREGLDLALGHGVLAGLAYLYGFLILAHVERAELDEAQRMLAQSPFPDALPPNAHLNYFRLGRGRLWIESGEVERGVAELLALGEVTKAVPFDNPALFAWRRFAVDGLLRLGRMDEARTLADEELAIARRWGARHEIGASLRARGLVEGGAEGRRLLEEAVEMFDGTEAQLQHARALIDLGAAYNRRVQERARAVHANGLDRAGARATRCLRRRRVGPPGRTASPTAATSTTPSRAAGSTTARTPPAMPKGGPRRRGRAAGDKIEAAIAERLGRPLGLGPAPVLARARIAGSAPPSRSSTSTATSSTARRVGAAARPEARRQQTLVAAITARARRPARRRDRPAHRLARRQRARLRPDLARGRSQRAASSRSCARSATSRRRAATSSPPAASIFAEPMTITGSIGIFYGKFDVSGLPAKLGVVAEHYKRGARADIESCSARTPTRSAAAPRQAALHLRPLRRRGRRGRNMKQDEVDAVGRGHVWTGEPRRHRGLVDDSAASGTPSTRRSAAPASATDCVTLDAMPDEPGSSANCSRSSASAANAPRLRARATSCCHACSRPRCAACPARCSSRRNAASAPRLRRHRQRLVSRAICCRMVGFIG